MLGRVSSYVIITNSDHIAFCCIVLSFLSTVVLIDCRLVAVSSLSFTYWQSRQVVDHVHTFVYLLAIQNVVHSALWSDRKSPASVGLS